MHVELAIPALFPMHGALQQAFDRLRPPTLELLVARGRIEHHPRAAFEAWLAQSFGLDSDTLPAGALTAIASDASEASVAEAAARGAQWMRADPVHLHLARDHLRLVPGAAFKVTQAESAALCETLNMHFAGRMSIHPSARDAGCWYACIEGAALPFNPPPLEAAGDDVDTHLRSQANAAGTGGAENVRRAHALLNELQMLLHEHPVNVAREARGEPAINSVWFWGAGQAPSRLPRHWRTVSAGDPLSHGLAQLSAARGRPLAASADSWLEDTPEDGHHLVVLDELRVPQALQDEERYLAGVLALEARWFAPLLEALRTQRVGMLTLQVPDATEALSIETVRADLRRFWRRPRALAPWKG